MEDDWDALFPAVGAAPQGQGGPVYGPKPVVKPPTPPSEAEMARVDIARQNAELQRQKFEYQQQQDAAKMGGGAKSADPKLQAKLANLDALTGQINRVQQLYDNNLRDEAIPLLGSLMEYLPTPTNRQFDSASAGMAEQGLAAFRVPGVGAQSDTELRQFVEANKPSAADHDLAIEEKLRQLRARVDATREQMGLPPAQWGDAPAEQQEAAPAASDDPTPPVFSPGDPMYAASTGTRTVDSGMGGIEAQYRQMLGENRPAGEIIKMLRDSGAGPQTLMQAVQQIKYRRENPGVPLDKYSISTTMEVPISAAEQAITDIGSGAGGAYAIGAGQFLSGNTLDNLAGDRGGLAVDVAQAGNPGAYGLGEFSGGMLAALTGEAGLARLGMASGFGRGVAADAAMGAANGAGMADGGDRLTGAAQGGLAGTLGSIAGAGAMKGAGAIMSPSGGKLADLYASGVRPTPGQRFGGSGIVGRAVNATEEALQSLPVVGAAITGARQEARDQFQVGAFNEALKEVGEELPKGMKAGTEPHRYAQGVFKRMYDTARSGMRVVADEQLANDLQNLAPDIQTLGPAMQNKLKGIMANTIKDDLSGPAYKRAMSDLGKHISRHRSGLTGEDQALADVLEGVRDSLDGAARRHSDPEAVQLLDAADAGYAKLVRIEEAASKRGGDAGTFSPTQFDSAVQKSSGGVRSKAYLRGDAAMQDYADQGKALVDRMPNSGTADRALAATTVAGGAAYVEPTTLGILATIGAAYAPGVRKAMTGAMAPAGPTRKAISQQLKKRARLAGRAGAAGAVASLPGTTPGQ